MPVGGVPAPGDELRITSTAADLARLYPWLHDAAAAHGIPENVSQAMHVALEEAVMNAAMHAYDENAPGVIVVRLGMSPSTATLCVEDRGPEFDPTKATPQALPDSLADAMPGGRGLVLLGHFCRDIAYRRDGEWNLLTLRFPLATG
jgi:anti-sigma regulatory factor (Ser/Thr protein kinase)